MKTTLVAVFAVLSAFAEHPGFVDSRGYPVIVPSVRQLKPATGAFPLPDVFTVSQAAAFDLLALERTYAAEVAGGAVKRVAEGGCCRFELSDTESPASNEGYRLVVATDGIRVTARTAGGLYHGMQTLAWMVRNRAGDTLRCCRIEDWPDLAIRGAFLEMNNLKSEEMDRQCTALEGLAALKYNVVLCDLADNLPFSFEKDFKREGSITKDDVAKFIATAKRCHIQIIPMLQVLSHAYWMTRYRNWEAIKEGEPTLHKIAWNSGYCPQNPEARRVVDAVIDETCEMFHPKYFHLGLDEQWGCPHRQCAKCRDRKWADLVVDHASPIVERLLAKGIRPIVFHDEFTRNNPSRGQSDLVEVLDRLNKKTIVNLWQYESNPSPIEYREIVERGHQGFFMSYSTKLENVMNLPRMAFREGSKGNVLAWWLRIRSTLDRTQDPLTCAATVLNAVYCWDAGAPDYNLLPYDPMVAFRQVLGKEREPSFSAPSTAVPLPATALVGGGDGRFPVLDAAGVRRLVGQAKEAGFDLVAAKGGSRLAALALTGDLKDGALPKEAEIDFSGRAEGFSFLTTAAPFNAFEADKGLPEIARFRVRYADGKVQAVPLRMKDNVTAWNTVSGGLSSRFAARINDANGSSVTLAAADWRNPRPSAEIVGLSLVSTAKDGIVPVLLGLTAYGEVRAGGAPAAAKPIDLVASAGRPFEPLYDFSSHPDLAGLRLVVNRNEAGKNGGVKYRKAIVDDPEYGKALEIVVPKDPNPVPHRMNVCFPLGPTQEFATVRYDLFCDHPEFITRSDLYVHGKGYDAAIGFIPSLEPGWTRLSVPRERMRNKESGGAVYGAFSDLQISFFVIPAEETVFRFTVPEVTMRREACRVDRRMKVAPTIPVKVTAKAPPEGTLGECLSKTPRPLAKGCRPEQVELLGGVTTGGSMRKGLPYVFCHRRNVAGKSFVQAQVAEGNIFKCLNLELSQVGAEVWVSVADALYIVCGTSEEAAAMVGRVDSRHLSRGGVNYPVKGMGIAATSSEPGYTLERLAWKVRPAAEVPIVRSVPPVLKVSMDRSPALYRCGEQAVFTIEAEPSSADGRLGGELVFEFSDFELGTVPETMTVSLETARVFRVTRTLGKPGFLRFCTEDGYTRKSDPWTVGFDVEKIRKGSPFPDDFKAFWQGQLRRAEAEVPLDAQMTAVPERSTKAYAMYRVSFASFGRRVYGTLSIPTKPGKHPLNVRIASAGFADFANFGGTSPDQAMLWFSVFPFRPDWEWRKLNIRADYDAMCREHQKKWGTNWPCVGLGGERTDYFFLPVIVAASRAVDWVAARPEIDKKNIVYNGGSQGGGLGMMLVALNGKFRKAYFSVPAITDTMGWLAGHRSGWPLAYESRRQKPDEGAAYLANMPYYDAANCCRLITCPVRISMGMRDTIVPPTAIQTAFNNLAAKDKVLDYCFDFGHGVPDKTSSKWAAWLSE